MAPSGVLVGRGYVSIRPEFTGDWSRSASSAGGAAGEVFAGAFAKVVKTMSIPIGAVGASVGAALATSFASAGAGAGAFAAAVKPQLTKVTEASELYTKAQEAAKEGGEKAAEAQKKYKAALAVMPPATRDTAKAFIGLKGDFDKWSDSLSSTTMPIFTRGINVLRVALPRLTPLVKSAAGAFSGFLDDLGKGQSGAVFREFGANMQDMAGSSLRSFLNIGKNIAVGFAGILNAFAPMSQGLTSGLEGLSARFAAFGAGLGESAGFQKFMAYVRENAPVVLSLLGSMATTAGHLIVALAPLGGATLLIVDAFASMVAAIPTPVLAVLAPVIATVALGLKAYALAVTVVTAVTRAWAFAQGVLSGAIALSPIGLIVGLVVALGAAFFVAWKRSETFRAIVVATWRGIQAAASFAWNSVLKPTISAIWAALRSVGAVAMWLWRNAIAPAFRGIASVAKWLMTIVAVLVIGPIVVAFRLLAAVGRWLWRNALAPAFRGIAAAGRWLWFNVLRPIVLLWVAQFRFLGRIAAWLWRNALAPAFRGIASVARWLWNSAIRPVFNWISDKAEWLYRYGIKPSFDAIKKAAGKVKDAFVWAKDGIGKAWNQLKSLTKKPIKWVIDWVYNKGIVGLWNAAASVLPIKKLKKFDVKGWATGGYTGDGPMHEPAGVVHRGEHVTRKSSTSRIERQHPGLLDYMNRWGRLPGFSSGGHVGPIGAHGGIRDWFGGTIDKIKDIGSKIKGWVLGGVHSAAKLAAKPVRALIDRIPGGKTGFGSLARAVPTGMLNAALDAIKGSEESQMGSGQWIKPVNAKYGTRFGVRGRMWSSGRHTGLDFPARTGTKVVAVDNGSITSARSGGPYGNHVSISHGGGLSSLYAHLSSIVERAGAVKRGQKIGEVGATGNVTGPHLHLEARKGGKPVDPMPYLTGGGGGPAGKGVQRWRGVASAVLRELGIFSSYNLNAVLRTIQKESGGNPRAINLWDSNAKRGTPSKGLIQTIDPTFNRWAGKYRSRGPYDPYANIYAGIRYARARYGAGWAARMSRPGGYDNGGWLQPGWNYNGLAKPEAVLTPQQWRVMERAAESGTQQSPTELTGDLYLDSGEFLGKVRGVVRSENAQLTSRFRAR